MDKNPVIYGSQTYITRHMNIGRSDNIYNYSQKRLDF